jgi:hypothetical protein
VRYDDDQHQERVPVEIRERPAMLSIPAYRERFHITRESGVDDQQLSA